MTQGCSSSLKWKMKFINLNSKYHYDLMQWTGSEDMNPELNLSFDSKDSAIAFAQKKHWEYKVDSAHTKNIIHKSYSDNFVS